VVNIYDIDSRTYEFKLALPPDTAAAASAIVTSSAVTETESVGGLFTRSVPSTPLCASLLAA
jgi:hypothetical protein